MVVLYSHSSYNSGAVFIGDEVGSSVSPCQSVSHLAEESKLSIKQRLFMVTNSPHDWYIQCLANPLVELNELCGSASITEPPSSSRLRRPAGGMAAEPVGWHIAPVSKRLSD